MAPDKPRDPSEVEASASTTAATPMLRQHRGVLRESRIEMDVLPDRPERHVTIVDANRRRSADETNRTTRNSEIFNLHAAHPGTPIDLAARNSYMSNTSVNSQQAPTYRHSFQASRNMLRSSVKSSNILRHSTDAGDSETRNHHVSFRDMDEESTSTLTSLPKKSFEPVVHSTMLPEPTLTRSNDLMKSRMRTALPNYSSWFTRQKAKLHIGGLFHSVIKAAKTSMLKINEIPPTKDGRHVPIDVHAARPLIDERTSHPYVGNTIRSTRYTAWNFVPRQLIAQFSKLANFYFLCVAILQMIPELSTTGTYTTIIPLMFFVCISMAKEGYDDLRRYRLDKQENRRSMRVLRKKALAEDSDPVWTDIEWQDAQVGDICLLKRDELIPADIILLHSTGEDGVAYIDTMALDGETNLKMKQVQPLLGSSCESPERVALSKGMVVGEDPNLDLYNFDGKLCMHGDVKPLTTDEIVYRGSILRNTTEIVGLIIYTGEECKIRMNANKNPRIKAPSLQAKVNRVVILIVLFVVALSIFMSVAYGIWTDSTEKKSWYLHRAHVKSAHIFTGFIIMFNTMIPLSLYVSLEIVKLGQMALMNDVDMYDEKSNTPMESRTSTINEELGQVSYIFSDKTGTLTENSMRFRKLSVAGTAFLHDTDIKREMLEKAQEMQHKSSGKRPMNAKCAKKLPALRIPEETDAVNNRMNSHVPPPQLNTMDLIRYIQESPHTVFARQAHLFILSIALCNTCVPEEMPDGTFTYQAASPDEVALITAAQELGFILIDRQTGNVSLKTFPHGLDAEPLVETYEVLDVIQFSSKRKRMSVVVRLPSGQICVLCKGADSTIINLLRNHTLAIQKAIDIERASHRRRSIEATEVIRRSMEASGHRRRSMDLAGQRRRSMDTAGTRRISLPFSPVSPLSPTAPSIDEFHRWISGRERDIESVYEDDISPVSPDARRSSAPARHSVRPSSVLEKYLHENPPMDEGSIFETCFKHVHSFASEGLRTLLYGYRYISDEEYTSWRKTYLAATTSLVNRQMLIEAAAEGIECNFELAGATAIEDRLQEGVPEAIEKLRRAGIKLWMLTGDKRETAINIGHSCHLIKEFSTVTILDRETREVEERIASLMVSINAGTIAHSVVIVDGQTLADIENDPPLHELFVCLAILVDTVICCRASPSQKASLVRTIRKKVTESVTLAIGDGANDIAMIQEAHVGIGITGKEGLQAARSSDYSIAQFRFLLKLLLVHGRWNYIRTSKYVLGTFYKEMLFFLTQAGFQQFAGFTGTSLYESISLTLFNTLFTSLPVIFIGIFERDLNPETLLAIPELYTKGQRNGAFSFKIYFGWMFLAASEAVIICAITFGLYGFGEQHISNADLYQLGVLSFATCVIMIWAKLQAIETHTLTLLTVLTGFSTMGAWWGFNLLLSAAYPKKSRPYFVHKSFLYGFGKARLFWAVLAIGLASCITFDLGMLLMRNVFLPSDEDIVQKMEKIPEFQQKFERESAREMRLSRRGKVEAYGALAVVCEDGRKSKLLKMWLKVKARFWGL